MLQKDNLSLIKFDKKYTDTIKGETIVYRVLFGNEKIVFIKSGSGRDPEEQPDVNTDNKYLQMAHRVRDRIGATVICASNPDITHYCVDKRVISFVASEICHSKFELYFV